MLPMSSSAVWNRMGGDEDDAASSWTRSSTNNNHHLNGDNNNNNEGEPPQNDQQSTLGSCFSNFKSMLDVEGEWYMNNVLNPTHQHHHDIRDLAFSSNQPCQNSLAVLQVQPMDSSASSSPSHTQTQSQPFHLDPSPPQSSLFPSKSCFSSLLNLVSTNPFDNAFDFPSDTAFLASFHPNQPSSSSALMGFTALNSHSHIPTPQLSSTADFPATRLPPSALDADFSPTAFEGFDGSAAAHLLNRAKLQVFPPMGAQPTLFQKRAALRQNSGGDGADKLGNLEISGPRYGLEGLGSLERKRKKKEEEGEMEEGSMDASGLNYDSEDEFNEYSQVVENVKNGGSNSNANSTVTTGVDGDRKGKKKGLPAKNLMAERRRRKKLNDRLYMLRSVVPKISKMDRASILGDAIDYLKELLQRINDLHTELESTSPGSLLPPPTSFHPLTPTPPTLPSRVKEELCPSSLASPKSQPKVEVRLREGQTVNIHMFCARRPGLLLSTISALDNLGLDIQQAVISCFNGFALDVFRAEQCRERQFLPEDIRAVLLDSAGFHDDDMML